MAQRQGAETVVDDGAASEEDLQEVEENEVQEGTTVNINRTESVTGDEAAAPQEEPLPLASQHSYFPGASHPLQSSSAFSGSAAISSSSASMGRSVSDQFDLVIIELPGVVLLPGMTIPLRLDEPGSFVSSSAYWMLYRQIQASRIAPGQAATVQVGILTKLDPNDELDIQALSNTTRTTTTRNRRGSGGGGIGENDRAIRRRRSSWMRRSFGPGRLRRFSEQLIQELGDVDVFLEQVESVNPIPVDVNESINGRPRSRHWQRRNSNRRREEEDDSDRDSNDDEISQDEIEFLHRRRSPTRNAEIQINNSNRSETTNSQRRSEDPYADRIGTLATVTCTHEDDEEVLGMRNIDSQGIHNQQARPRSSLSLTAVGTGRFRIPCSDSDTDTGSQHRSTLDDPFSYSKIFIRSVQEWNYERIASVDSPQPHPDQFAFCMNGASRRFKFDMSMMYSVSTWPKQVYDGYWPWKLMHELKQKMEAAVSLKEILDSQEGNIPQHPLKFSYWLAMNLPLEERERLYILQCPTMTERLRWFQRHSLFDFELPEEPTWVQNDNQQEKHRAEQQQQDRQQEDPSDFKDFICKSCQIPLSPARSLFTLGGAEGTVGNYVNEYGVVHATITVRDIDPNEVELMGNPETKNSWFPGYAWTIMRCALCYSHLGWRFTRANDNGPITNMRPLYFYGLSGACVTLITNTRRQRRASSTRSQNNGHTRRIRQRNTTGSWVEQH